MVLKMIFVTVGTHEQPFNRLVEYVDRLAQSEEITEEIIIQTGYSTYKPKNCIYKEFFSYQEMLKNVSDASIVITHGGLSSFIMPLQVGKIPIVIPRKKEFNEHVNNHQIEFSRIVQERMKTIIVVENINNLGKTIKEYDEIVFGMNSEINYNNAKFCDEFEKIVNEIVMQI